MNTIPPARSAAIAITPHRRRVAKPSPISANTAAPAIAQIGYAGWSSVCALASLVFLVV
jgi:hypothetical protein